MYIPVYSIILIFKLCFNIVYLHILSYSRLEVHIRYIVWFLNNYIIQTHDTYIGVKLEIFIMIISLINLIKSIVIF